MSREGKPLKEATVLCGTSISAGGQTLLDRSPLPPAPPHLLAGPADLEVVRELHRAPRTFGVGVIRHRRGRQPGQDGHDREPSVAHV